MGLAVILQPTLLGEDVGSRADFCSMQNLH
jgi:hypothetical protein